MGVPPVIILFNGIFSINHPAIGIPPFMETPMWNSAPATPSARHRSLPEVSPPIQKRTCPQSDLPEEKKLQADSTQLKKQDTLGTRHGYIIEWSTVGLRVFVSTLIVFNYVIYIYYYT